MDKLFTAAMQVLGMCFGWVVLFIAVCAAIEHIRQDYKWFQGGKFYKIRAWCRGNCDNSFTVRIPFGEKVDGHICTCPKCGHEGKLGEVSKLMHEAELE